MNAAIENQWKKFLLKNPLNGDGNGAALEMNVIDIDKQFWNFQTEMTSFYAEKPQWCSAFVIVSTEEVEVLR